MADNKIFVSYRRQDASGEAGRLVDHLQEVFGEESVFLDVETIEAGLDFVQAIDKALNSCKVLIAMIGPHWLNMRDSEGNLRLFQEGDFIRIEISAALKRNIRVIPVLVNGAVMPTPDQLPEDLQALTRRHAQELSSSRWKYDCDQLIQVLSKIIEPKPIPQPTPRPTPRPVPPKKKSWLAKNYLWVLGGFVSLLILIQLMDLPEEDFPNDPYQPPVEEDYGNTDDPTVEDLQQFREDNPGGTEINDNLTGTATEIEDVSGYWRMDDNQGNFSTFIFELYEDGEVEFLEYNQFNIQIGSGTGVANGTDLTLDYYNSLFQLNGNFKLKTYNQGKSWSGNVNFPSLGTSSPITFQRINP